MNVNRTLLNGCLSHLLDYQQKLEYHVISSVKKSGIKKLNEVIKDLLKLLKVKVLKYNGRVKK